jgi:hypothetical protein
MFFIIDLLSREESHMGLFSIFIFQRRAVGRRVPISRLLDPSQFSELFELSDNSSTGSRNCQNI